MAALFSFHSGSSINANDATFSFKKYFESLYFNRKCSSIVLCLSSSSKFLNHIITSPVTSLIFKWSNLELRQTIY